MKKILLTLFGLLLALPGMADVFTYEYKGQTLRYNVLNEDAKTCEVFRYGNNSGNLIIPSIAKDGNTEYSVTSIGHEAFYKCSDLTSVTLPNSVTSIDKDAFRDCSGLTEVHISDIAAWCKIQFSNNFSNPLYYAHHLYLNNTEISDLTIPEGVTEINNYAFFGYSSLMEVTIPNTVTSIGSYTFCDCTNMKSITIPNSVTSIGTDAFRDCSGLTEVHISDIAAWCKTHFRNNFSNPLYYAHHLYLNNTEISDLTIPEGVTKINNYAFYRCNGLTEVTISNTVTSIGFAAFSDCNGLTSVTIPNSVTSIDSSTFHKCSKLTSVTIPNSITSIDSNAFRDCSGLTEVHISDIAAWCKIQFSNDDSNPLFYAHHLYLNDNEITDLTIPEGLIEIKKHAFCGYTGLTSVTIPNSIASINSNAFYKCSSLKEVHISDIAAWCKIQFSNYSNPLFYAHHLYLNDTEITDLIIPEGVSEINDIVFCNCSGLTSVTIPNSVTSIGSSAFASCSGLMEVTIGNSVTSIGNSTFSGCHGLMSITIPNSVTSIGNSVFSDCSGLTSVIIPNSITSIGDETFRNCGRLTSATIGNSVTSIGNSAFAGCYDLMKVTSLNTTPPDLNSSFELRVKNNATLHVPVGCRDTYASASEWRNFRHIVDDAVDSVDDVIADGIEGEGIDFSAPYEVCNLQGVHAGDCIDILAQGIYIIRQGNVVKKVTVK